LGKPYFYIFVLDPDNKIRAAFPCFCNQKGVLGEVLPYSDNYQCSGETCWFKNSKFNSWVSADWNQNGQLVHCTDKENTFCVDNSCISRNIFINGINEDKQTLVYSYKPDKVGTWTIHSFLFDEKYITRDYNPSSVLNEQLADNAIEYNFAKIEVVNKIEKPVDSLYWITPVATIIMSFLSALLTVFAWHKIFKPKFPKYKKYLLPAIIILIFLILLSWFFCNLGCPMKSCP